MAEYGLVELSRMPVARDSNVHPWSTTDRLRMRGLPLSKGMSNPGVSWEVARVNYRPTIRSFELVKISVQLLGVIALLSNGNR